MLLLLSRVLLAGELIYILMVDLDIFLVSLRELENNLFGFNLFSSYFSCCCCCACLVVESSATSFLASCLLAYKPHTFIRCCCYDSSHATTSLSGERTTTTTLSSNSVYTTIAVLCLNCWQREAPCVCSFSSNWTYASSRHIHAKRHVLRTAAAPSVSSPSLQRRADGEASPQRAAVSHNSMSAEKRQIPPPSSRPVLLAELPLPRVVRLWSLKS